jgi:hypothetical protein
VGQHKRKKKPIQDLECTSDQPSRFTERKDPTQNGKPAKVTTAKKGETTRSFKRFSDISIDPNLPPQELPANNQSEPQELPAQLATGPFPRPYSSYTPYSDITGSSSLFSKGLSASLFYLFIFWKEAK